MNDQHLARAAKAVFVLFAVIAALLLLAVHSAHVIPYLPWLFLAACPLMHLFMHHGKHRHGSDQAAGRGRNAGEGADHA